MIECAAIKMKVTSIKCSVHMSKHEKSTLTANCPVHSFIFYGKLPLLLFVIIINSTTTNVSVGQSVSLMTKL